MGKLYLSYFANPNKSKGIRISVTRFMPKGIKMPDHVDKWYKSLSPSNDTLNEYKNNKITWEEYIIRFYADIYNDESLDDLMDIKQLLKSGEDVTLICYEKNEQNCHRYLLGEILKRNMNGLEVIKL